MQFQDGEYARLKGEIDKLISGGVRGADLEIQKATILKQSQPYVKFLAAATGRSPESIIGFIEDLGSDTRFFANIAAGLELIQDRSCGGLQTGELRVHIYTDYVVVRALMPDVMVETGVCNGKSSAFVLNAMDHNGRGHLHSIDLPVHEEEAD